MSDFPTEVERISFLKGRVQFLRDGLKEFRKFCEVLGETDHWDELRVLDYECMNDELDAALEWLEYFVVKAGGK